jgi:PAS domain S-box-containing protein
LKNSPDIISILNTKDIFNNSHDAFIISDSEKNIRFANRSALKMFGYSEEELLGKSIHSLMSEERTANYNKQMKEVLSGKVVSNIDSGEDLRGKRKNGEIFSIELTYVSSISGNDNYFISQIRDISERKTRESELSVALKDLKIISESNRLLVRSENEKEYLNGICDIITGLSGFSKSLILLIEEKDDDKILLPVAFSGYQPDSAIKYPFRISTIKDSGSPTFIAIEEKRTEVCVNIKARGLWKYWKESPEEMEFDSTISIPIIKKDKVVGLLRVYSYEPFAFDDHEVKLLEELAEDISYGISALRERKELETTMRLLEESENKYKNLFDNSSDAVILADADTGIIIDANRKAEDILKTSPEEIRGINLSEIHAEGYEEKYRKLLDDLQNLDRCVSDEFYLKIGSAEGKAVPVHVSVDHVYINERKIIQSIFRNISEQKAEEEKIRAAQKMEALGTLSGGIAHDINNILSPVIGFTQIALLEADNREKQMSCLNEVLTAAGRAKELVSQILTFCRKSETDKKPVKIQSILKEVIKLISSSIPGNVTIETVIDDNCGHIMCDPIQIYQVVINLCTNAFHAMKETGGVLKVCLVRKGSPEIKSDKAEVITFNDYICLIVSDTGCGMCKTTLNRIFEPYFSTKPKGEGTGLGLSVVSGIIKEHDGEIYVRTYPDEGTYFKITFPLAPVKSENKAEDITTAGRNGKLRVLVVDDEPQITFMLKYMLEELGFNPEVYNDPQKALKAFTSEPLDYDLLITDQSMPHLTGTELAEKALQIRPELPIILNTGYSPVISKKEALRMGIKEFMMKPLTISDISIVMERALKRN